MSNQPTMAAAPVRAWVLVLALALACGLLQLRPSDAAAPAQPVAVAATMVSSGAAKPKCVPGAKNDKACRVGAVHDPENQEEEGSSVTLKAPAAAPDDSDGSDYNDPDEPNDNQLIVVGH
ncbi:uncharacterized protein [Zea mays]|jgi:hypothetical protein|uniref:Uncharacterized protein n=1 Tax=Zea mays TaxID=4577 RepID=K7VFB0_MAIZE|nr:uncharacterized protein LOC103638751 [Zea mays]AQL04781.1 hypothetical protein ZEAMMB73_Zm00001d046641 [Zea mays]|eukprot:XP_008659798.1 uncharacterized protein LOC103638751 [Zea mays]